MTLLSVLRRGDHRFLPLLLSKVHDVLPRLVNPMLQTVPDKALNEIDIFDGFGNAGMGVATGMHSGSDYTEVNNEYKSMTGSGAMTSEFKMPLPSQGLSNMYDNKRIEELSSPSGESHGGNNSPFTPPIMTSAIDYPGLSEFSFPDMNNPAIGNSSPAPNNFGNDFKSDGGHHLGVSRPGPPMRQDSAGSFGTMSGGIPRSIPDFVNTNGHHHMQRATSDVSDMGMGAMQRTGSHGDRDMGMNGSDIPFR